VTEPTVDTRAIVETIKSEVARKRAEGEYPDELVERLRSELKLRTEDEPLEALADVNLYRPVASNRPGIGPAIVFGKKVLRRTISWYVAPLILDQNRFNRRTVRELRTLSAGARWETRIWQRRAGDFLFEAGLAGDRDAAIAARVGFAQHQLDKLDGTADVAVVGGHVAQISAGLGRRATVQLQGDPLQALLLQQPSSLDVVVAYSVLGFLPSTKLLPFLETAASRLRPGGLLLGDGWGCTGRPHGKEIHGKLPKGEDGAGGTVAEAPGVLDPLMARWLPRSALLTVLSGRFDLATEEELGVFGPGRLFAVAAIRKP